MNAGQVAVYEEIPKTLLEHVEDVLAGRHRFMPVRDHPAMNGWAIFVGP